MDPDWQGLSPRLLTVWRLLSCLIVTAFAAAATAVAAYATGSAAAIATASAAAALLGVVIRLQTKRYRAWGYSTRDQDLMVRRGVVIRRVSVVPYGRMQFVDVAQGPLDRRFGIASVVLHTAAAATDARIPGLPEDEAAKLRDRLAELGEAHAAGL